MVRVGGCAVFGGAVAVFLTVNPHCAGTVHNACPGYSFDDPWVLRFERATLALVVLLAVLTILVRVVVGGDIPDQVTRDGLAWSAAPAAVRDANIGIKELRSALSLLGVDVSKSTVTTRQLLADLNERVRALEEADDR